MQIDQSKQERLEWIQDHLKKVQVQIADLSKEEVSLLKEMDNLEKELYPDLYQKKVDAILALLRYRRTSSNG